LFSKTFVQTFSTRVPIPSERFIEERVSLWHVSHQGNEAEPTLKIFSSSSKQAWPAY